MCVFPFSFPNCVLFVFLNIIFIHFKYNAKYLYNKRHINAKSKQFYRQKGQIVNLPQSPIPLFSPYPSV